MKNKIVLLFFLMMCLNGMAQMTQSDHLEPLNGYFEQYSHQYEYFGNIKTILFKGLSEHFECRFFVPDSHECVLQIELSPERSMNIEYDLVYKIAKQPIWGTKDTSSIQVDTWRNRISNGDVDLIVSLFRQAISGVKYPEVTRIQKYNDTDLMDHVIIVDGGPNYFFSYQEYIPTGFRSGKTWAPGKGSKMGRLVDVALKLTEWAKSNKGTVVLPDDLKNTVVNLTNELKDGTH